jgi:ketosteroid isomerase-like protein
MQNLELVRGTMETYSRGDLDLALSAFHPEVVFRVGGEIMPDADVFRGRDGVRAFWDLWRDAFEGFELVIEDCRAIDDTHVMTRNRGRGRGAGSGAPVASRPFSQLMEIRDGQIVRVWVNAREASALRAAGLSS